MLHVHITGDNFDFECSDLDFMEFAELLMTIGIRRERWRQHLEREMAKRLPASICFTNPTIRSLAASLAASPPPSV